jgi:transposase
VRYGPWHTVASRFYRWQRAGLWAQLFAAVQAQADAARQLMTLVLTPGQRHEAVVFDQLMQHGAVKREGPGRPQRRPRRIVGDKGYSSGHIRHYARQHGMRGTLPRKSNACRCKQFRRIATRDEQRAANYKAM